jgi:hypothetical protein
MTLPFARASRTGSAKPRAAFQGLAEPVLGIDMLSHGTRGSVTLRGS